MTVPDREALAPRIEPPPVKRAGYAAYLVLATCALAVCALRIAGFAMDHALAKDAADVALPAILAVAAGAFLSGLVATVAHHRDRDLLGLTVVAPGLLCAALMPELHPAVDAALLAGAGAGALFAMGVARRGLARSTPPRRGSPAL
jgi:hypothetical protein